MLILILLEIVQLIILLMKKLICYKDLRLNLIFHSWVLMWLMLSWIEIIWVLMKRRRKLRDNLLLRMNLVWCLFIWINKIYCLNKKRINSKYNLFIKILYYKIWRYLLCFKKKGKKMIIVIIFILISIERSSSVIHKINKNKYIYWSNDLVNNKVRIQSLIKKEKEVLNILLMYLN